MIVLASRYRRDMDAAARSLAETRVRAEALVVAAERERDWLREQVQALQDRLYRLERRRHGMPEEPRSRQQKGHLVVPPELEAFIDGFDSSIVRQDLRERVQRLARIGVSPADALERLRAEYGIPDTHLEAE